MGEPRSADNVDWIRVAVAQYEHRLVSYAAHLVGDLERGRDIVQETFFRLCRQERDTVEPRLAEWLFTVCRNLSLDIRRKERRMTLLAEGQAESQDSPEPQPGLAIEQQELVTGVLAMLKTLSANQQEVIRLKFQQGLSYKEIADVTHLSVTNVGFLIHTGLKLVRQRMGIENEKSTGASHNA